VSLIDDMAEIGTPEIPIPTVTSVNIEYLDGVPALAYVEINYSGLWWNLDLENAVDSWQLIGQARVRRHATTSKYTLGDPPEWMLNLAVDQLEDP